MTEKKANHQANVVRLGAPRVHTNADSLELFDIGGYQVVTKKGNFKEGDLAVYIQPDSVVPQTEPFRWLWADYLKRPEMCQHSAPAGQSVIVVDGDFHCCLRCNARLINGETALPEHRRRITVKRLRKEWSEGLLMPLSDFEGIVVNEGNDVSDLLGLTHYEDPEEVESTQAGAGAKPKRKYPKTLRGWFYFLIFKLGFKTKAYTEEITFNVPKFGVENFKNYKHAIKPGEYVVVTEKIHGSQARYVFFEGKMYAGSRTQWKNLSSPCAWRRALDQNPWIETWCRSHEGHTLYGEVFPTKKGFRYGKKDGEVGFLMFDIRDENGKYYSKVKTLTAYYTAPVPIIYAGPFSDEVLKLADGLSTVPGADHVREGVVVTVVDQTRWERGLGRVQLKVVSNSFLEKDSK